MWTSTATARPSTPSKVALGMLAITGSPHWRDAVEEGPGARPHEAFTLTIRRRCDSYECGADAGRGAATAAPDYLPRKTGSRFSVNAAIASDASWDEKLIDCERPSSSRACSIETLRPLFSMALVSESP